MKHQTNYGKEVLSTARKGLDDEIRDFMAVVIKSAPLTPDTLLQAINDAINNAGQQSKQGKQSLDSLMKDGSKLQNVEVTGKNIKSFEKSARKFGIDYAVKKVAAENADSQPTYIVFFKGKDTEQVNRAFKDYVKRQTKQREKPSVVKEIKAIQKEQEKERKDRTLEHDHKKERGMQL